MRRIISTILVAIITIPTVVVSSACSIPTDDRAHEIPPDALGTVIQSSTSTTSSTVAPAGSRRETLYLVRTGDPATSGSERLEAVVIDVPGANDAENLPRTVVERLINLSPAELGQSGLVNALPKGTRVIAATVGDDDILDLDLSGLADIESALQRLAFAQVVFTVTGLTTTSIKGVRFSVDGEPAAVPVEEGTKGAGDVVKRDDYPKLRDQIASVEPVAGSD